METKEEPNLPDFTFPSSQNVPKQRNQPPPPNKKPLSSQDPQKSPNTSESSLPASFHRREGEVSGRLQSGRAAPGVGSAPRLRTAPAPPPRPSRPSEPPRPSAPLPALRSHFAAVGRQQIITVLSSAASSLKGAVQQEGIK